MANQTEAKLPSGQIAKWRDQEYPTIYANMMGITMTPFDIGVIFGEVHEATPEQVTGIPRIKLLLAPEQASNLVKLLNVALEAYVKANGQIRLGGAVNMDDFKKIFKADTVEPKKQ